MLPIRITPAPIAVRIAVRIARLIAVQIAAGTIASGVAAPAFAQGAFPNKPITMVVGFAPGGGTDTAARIIAKKLTENTGQNVIVENRSGAGGNIAAAYVAKANPDGYTILLTAPGSVAVAPHQNSNLPYDPRTELTPITMAVVFPNVIVVHPSVQARTLAEYIKLSIAKPGTMSYGSSGIGNAGHLAGELFKIVTKADITHVPYKGGGPAMADLLGGQVPSVFASAPSAVPQIKAGKIRALAITGATRSAFLPDVPTVAESGYPNFEATNWYAYVAPGKTPRPVVEQLNRELVKVLNTPEVRNQLFAQGMEALPMSIEQLSKYIEREYATWGRVVKEAGIQAE
jgi:tripartite-type tricarboxylate transporter receptor subunit TctC